MFGIAGVSSILSQSGAPGVLWELVCPIHKSKWRVGRVSGMPAGCMPCRAGEEV